MLGCRLWGARRPASPLRGMCLSSFAAKLLEKLSEYEIVTPTRVNEFGEPFPTDVHFRRRRRSTNAAPDAWTAAAASSSSSPKAHYRLSAFGQQFLFNLTASSAFIAPLFTVSILGEPAAEQRNLYAETADTDVKHCFYRGHVNARPRHTAVISLCSGMVSPGSLPRRAPSGGEQGRKRGGGEGGAGEGGWAEGRGAAPFPPPSTGATGWGRLAPVWSFSQPTFIIPSDWGKALLFRGFWGKSATQRHPATEITGWGQPCCGAPSNSLGTDTDLHPEVWSDG